MCIDCQQSDPNYVTPVSTKLNMTKKETIEALVVFFRDTIQEGRCTTPEQFKYMFSLYDTLYDTTTVNIGGERQIKTIYSTLSNIYYRLKRGTLSFEYYNDEPVVEPTPEEPINLALPLSVTNDNKEVIQSYTEEPKVDLREDNSDLTTKDKNIVNKAIDKRSREYKETKKS